MLYVGQALFKVKPVSVECKCVVPCWLLGRVGAIRRVLHHEVVHGLAVAVTGHVTGGLVLATERSHRTVGIRAGKGVIRKC